LNFVLKRRFQSGWRGFFSPVELVHWRSFGRTVKAQRTPVKPPLFEKLRNSIAQRRAPGIS